MDQQHLILHDYKRYACSSAAVHLHSTIHTCMHKCIYCIPYSLISPQAKPEISFRIIFSLVMQATAAARVTKLFAEELPSEKRMYATRATQAAPRDCTLFGVPIPQPGMERLVIKKSDLRHRQGMQGLAVELLWQEDGQWWPATITQVQNPMACTQLVYEI